MSVTFSPSARTGVKKQKLLTHDLVQCRFHVLGFDLISVRLLLSSDVFHGVNLESITIRNRRGQGLP
jgi:hypothetical protein